MGIDRKQVRSAAQKQVRKGNWKNAIAKYEELVESDPEDVRSRLKLADLYTRVGRQGDAVQTYREAGDHHADQDIYQKAVAVYKQAIRLEPEDPELHRKVGEAYHRLDRLKDAVQAFKRAQKHYKEAGEKDQQLEILEELVRLDPEDVGLRIQLAETYAKQNEDDRALERFREAAEMLAEEGHYDEYVQVAERILYFEPEDREVRKQAIQIYIDQGDNKRALKHLQICFSQDSRDEATLRQLAETFMRLDRTEKASLVFQKLASVYRESAQLERARRTWQRILDIDPTNETAQKALRTYGEPETPAEQPSPAAERDRAESKDIPTISEDQERTTSQALEEIEFIDENPDSGPQTPEPQEGVSAEADGNSSGERVAAASDSGSQTTASAHGPTGTPESPADSGAHPPAASAGTDDPTAPDPADPPEASASTDVDGSSPDAGPADPERERAPTNQTFESPVDREELEASPVDPGLGETSSTGSDELDELLNEADVFLKYGLYDKAREVIHKILERAPNSLAAYEKRRRLYAELDEPRAEAATLVDMARMASHQPPKARHFLKQALEVGGADDQVERAAEDIGVDLPDVATADNQPERPPAETKPGIDVPEDSDASFDETAGRPEETPIGGEHDLDDLDIETDGRIGEGDSSSVVELDDDEFELLDAEESNTAPPPTDPKEPDAFDVSESAEELDASVQQIEEDEDFGDEELEPVEGGLEEASQPSGSISESFDPSHTQPPEADLEETAGGPDEPDSLGFTETEVEGALDDLFEDVDDGITAPSEAKSADDNEVLDVIDSLIDQGSYDDALHALESFAESHPQHPGIEERREEIELGKRRSQFERKPTGARSLSGQFQPEELDSDDDSGAGDLQLGDDVVNTNLEVGTAYRDMGMYDEAIDEFRQAIEDPDAAPAATYNIALCKAEQGDIDDATDVLSRLANNDDLSADLRSAARELLDELSAR